jgi:hypothetical protein
VAVAVAVANVAVAVAAVANAVVVVAVADVKSDRFSPFFAPDATLSLMISSKRPPMTGMHIQVPIFYISFLVGFHISGFTWLIK